jgi:hypothetical protein
MNAKSGGFRLTALATLVAMSLVGVGGVASAKTHGHHHGAAPSAISITASPTLAREVGQSVVADVIQVETNPSFAGDAVTINASKLAASCKGDFSLDTLQGGTPNALVTASKEINVVLDDDGNVTVVASGENCVPGRRKIEAELDVEPFYTASMSLKVKSSIATTSGMLGEPQTDGATGEVETGDTSNSGFSDVYALFYVETGAGYSGQPVEVDFSQLAASCSEGWEAAAITGQVSATNTNTSPEITSNLDSNGNAAFLFVGAMCAPTTSQVNAEVEAETDPTYSTTFTVDPPAPVI